MAFFMAIFRWGIENFADESLVVNYESNANVLRNNFNDYMLANACK